MSKSKLVVITGASSGIGAALAKIFSQAGYSLGLLSRNLFEMEKLNLPNATCFSVDVTDFSAVKEIISSLEKIGPIDCLINNAGFLQAGDFVDVNNAHHQKMIDVNIMGVINFIELVLPLMRERKQGTIINMSSLADRKSSPNFATYAATKAAVKSLSESLRMKNAPYGIRICNVAPGKIDTPMVLKANLRDEQVIPAEEFAKTILWMYQLPQSMCVRDMAIGPTYYES